MSVRKPCCPLLESRYLKVSHISSRVIFVLDKNASRVSHLSYRVEISQAF